MSPDRPGTRSGPRLYHGSSMNEAENDRGDTLVNALGVLRRRWAILAACVLGCVLIAIVMHERKVTTYQATASVAFGVSNLSDSALEVAASASDPARDAATNVLIAHSNEVATAVAKQIGGNHTASELLAQTTVEAAPNADVLDITSQNADSANASLVANAFATQYIAFVAKSQTDSIVQTEDALREQLAALPAGSQRADSINSSLERLAQLRAVANGNARVIGRAGVATPTGTGLKLTVVLGILIGTALGLTIIFVLEAVDRRLTRIEDLEREYRLPALTAVPQSAFRSADAAVRRENLEPYRILRSVLDISTVETDVFTVLVTSAVPGEGKTTAAIDLAQAVALTGRSVTLVELDLRRPTFSRHFNVDPRRGVTNVLTGRQTLGEVLVRPFPELPSLAVVPSGQLPPNPSELLGSSPLEELLTRLTYLGDGEGRMIVIDAPPLLPVADAQVLLNNPAIDRVLVVTRSGKTTRDEIRRARAILDRHLLQPLGLVVTGVRDSSQYGYEPLNDVAGPPATPPRQASADGAADPLAAVGRRRIDA
jgi:capsular exopolysaccharide synthesis family protein